MTELQKKWPTRDFCNCQCPYCGHRDDVAISAVRDDHLDWSPSDCSENFGESWQFSDGAAVMVKKSDTNANTFRIHHHHHIGDQGATIQAPHGLDTKRAAVYLQFQAETWFGDEVTLTNRGVAAALVSFYGCKQTPHSRHAEDLDMSTEREKLCSQYYELMADVSLMRDGLKEFLKDHLVE